MRAWQAWAAGLLLAAACRPARPRPVAPRPAETLSATAAREWRAVFDSAQALVRGGAHPAADSLLDGFRARYPGTPAAVDALLWRGLVRADPANAAQSTRAAAADLSAYESGGALHVYGAQAVVVRRLLAQVDSLRDVIATERTAAAALVPRDSVKPRNDDEELTKLRLELEQARAELDRVRRRLAPPRRP